MKYFHTNLRKLFFWCFLIYSLSTISNPVYSDKKDTSLQGIRALLSVSLAKFTSWPNAEFINSNITFCIVGDNIINTAFNGLNNKAINGKYIIISNRSQLRNLSGCHLLFITKIPSTTLQQILLEIKGKPILTISNSIAFLKAGGMVALVHKNGKMQLNINLSSVKNSGLTISSQILKLATIFEANHSNK